MRIGVKYCGGCNPHYDRKQAVEELKSRFPEVVFEPAQEKMEYDRVLLVCGCPRACIQNRKTAKAAKYCVLKGQKDFETIYENMNQEMK